jgi:hypothetical protein
MMTIMDPIWRRTMNEARHEMFQKKYREEAYGRLRAIIVNMGVRDFLEVAAMAVRMQVGDVREASRLADSIESLASSTTL